MIQLMEMFILGVLQSVDFSSEFLDGSNQQRDDFGVSNTQFIRIVCNCGFWKCGKNILSNQE
jgi:hypothetical protein